MPSKGSKIVPVRIPQEMLDEMQEMIASRNFNAPGEPWDVAKFIRKAVAEKIAHMKRSRKGRDSSGIY